MNVPLLLETVRIENGNARYLSYHEARMKRSIEALSGQSVAFDLSAVIDPPANEGILRCRILYDTAVRRIEYIPYTPRIVRTLALVESDIDYAFKYADRSALDALKAAHPKADDVLIVKNGCVTDTTIANIAFYDGTRWLTPATPLLEGTTRARLIDEGFLKPATIRPDDIGRYESVALLNAMQGFVNVKNVTIIR
jgi:4-amino-4-deoxychorismate lyase